LLGYTRPRESAEATRMQDLASEFSKIFRG